MARTGTRTERMRDDGILAGVERRGWALLPFVSVLAYVVSGVSAAGGVVLGGALGLLNFKFLKHYFNFILQRGRRPSGWLHVVYLAKFGVMALILAAAFRYAGPHPLGVIAGFSIMVVAAIWAGLGSSGNTENRRGVHPLEGMETRG